MTNPPVLYDAALDREKTGIPRGFKSPASLPAFQIRRLPRASCPCNRPPAVEPRPPSAGAVGLRPGLCQALLAGVRAAKRPQVGEPPVHPRAPSSGAGCCPLFSPPYEGGQGGGWFAPARRPVIAGRRRRRSLPRPLGSAPSQARDKKAPRSARFTRYAAASRPPPFSSHTPKTNLARMRHKLVRFERFGDTLHTFCIPDAPQ